MSPVDLAEESAALDEARAAAADKLIKLRTLDVAGAGADALTADYVESVVSHAIEKLQNELTVFGRIDDDATWRIGLYGVEQRGSQLVIDWRAPFAQAFYQAQFDDPMGLLRRISYVGSIDELFVEDFTTSEVSGSSPLLNELSRNRSETMRAAVATLQSEQDDLVRQAPDTRMVIRGGPGTGKTVVGLHRAAWLVYNDRRVLSADSILVVGPTDRYLQYVASVLPTLGEAKVRQTTLERLLGPTSEIGASPDWPVILDRFEASLYNPTEVKIRFKRVKLDDVSEILDRVAGSTLPWRAKRKGVESSFMRLTEMSAADVRDAVAEVMPACSARQAWKKLRSRAVLAGLGVDTAFVDAWLAVDEDGPLFDELKARFEEPAMKYSHVIVDEAQDLTEMQLRAMARRSAGLTMVGDDAQTSVPGALGLREVAHRLDVTPAVLATAYRMSAEIADWLNTFAESVELPAVELIGIRPTGVDVVRCSVSELDAHEQRISANHENWRRLDHRDVWVHKGIEYDAVIVDGTEMTPAEVYLAASRAAHELVVALP